MEISSGFHKKNFERWRSRKSSMSLETLKIVGEVSSRTIITANPNRRRKKERISTLFRSLLQRSGEWKFARVWRLLEIVRHSTAISKLLGE
jgi:hypothetical protein